MYALVVGATGQVGGEIALKLVGHQINTAALVRGGRAHPKSKQLESKGIDVIEGDLCRAETFADTLKNSETIICTATSMPSAANDGLRKVDHKGMLALIESAERQGVKKFVYTSYSTNIREDSPLETAKRDCENLLLNSKMKVVILRPSYFMEMWLGPLLGFDPVNGSVRIYGSGEAKVSYISCSNVAAFGVAAAIREYPQKNTILELGGPEALSQLEALRIFEKVLSKKAAIEYVPKASLEAQHKSSDPLQQTFAALMLAYAKGDLISGAAFVAQQHGIKLRSVSEYASSLGGVSTSVVN
jgi:NADH dehydrogenase